MIENIGVPIHHIRGEVWASRRYGLRLLGHTAREVSDLSFGDGFKFMLRILLQCKGTVLDENRELAS
jgi:hypothetical protein